jgi:uncharacterized protein YuzE
MRQPKKLREGKALGKSINLSSFADGAVSERFNIELLKVLENISDPNTDPKKSRKLQLNITLKGNENRDIASVGIQAKTTLAPAKDIESNIVLDYDSNGKVIGSELKSGIKGQTYVNEDGEVVDDKGNDIVEYQKKRDAK